MEIYNNLKYIEYDEYEEIFEEYSKDNDYKELYILKIAIEAYLYKIENKKEKGE